MSFAAAEKIADAVLYEGYLLYPYRASAAKNQLRWQFGVLMPRGHSENGGGEPWHMQTECLIEPGDNTLFDIRVRFLAAQERRIEKASENGRFDAVEIIEANGQQYIPWDEGVEEQRDFTNLDLRALLAGEQIFSVEIPGANWSEPIRGSDGTLLGRIVRQRFPLSAWVRISAESLGLVIRLRVRLENLTAWVDAGADRNVALRHALIAAHTIIAAHDGAFLSLVDAPEWARAAAASCVNLHSWPVLVGNEGDCDMMLAAPIILPDYPTIAPESAGDMFDGTEIDEILTLRTMALTDAEKRAARATDGRAAAIIERVDSLASERLRQLHGALRPSGPTGKTETCTDAVPWWSPEADASVSPETDSVDIGGIAIAKGSVVRLQPARRADAQDMFLTGRLANVQALFHDVDGGTHVAVTLADDPAADLHGWYGRYYYFAPNELQPMAGPNVQLESQTHTEKEKPT